MTVMAAVRFNHDESLVTKGSKVHTAGSQDFHLTATGCQLPYGITVLPATRHR